MLWYSPFNYTTEIHVIKVGRKLGGRGLPHLPPQELSPWPVLAVESEMYVCRTSNNHIGRAIRRAKTIGLYHSPMVKADYIQHNSHPLLLEPTEDIIIDYT